MIPFGLTAATSATDAGIRKKCPQFRDNNTENFKRRNGKYIMKIVKTFEDSSLLIDSVTKTIENYTREQRCRFLAMLLCTLGASLLVNILASKGVIRAGDWVIEAGHRITQAGEWTIKHEFSYCFILWPILKSKDIIKMKPNLMVFFQKIIYLTKYGAYVINLDKWRSIKTHWIAFYLNDSNGTYFDRFGGEYFQKKLKNSWATKI